MPNLQTNDPLSRLEFSSRVAKRAQYEAFEFTIDDEGVRVRNNSHAVPNQHEYIVTVTGGVPESCTCPADTHHDGACKHRVAVAIRAPVLAAANGRVVADGGKMLGEKQASDGLDVEECADCRDEFPCWECVRTGRRVLPE